MGVIVASGSDVARLLRLYRVRTLAELIVQINEWDHEDAFLDSEGQLCLLDQDPNSHPRTYIEGVELDGLFEHYGVENNDLECLRRRMIFEETWEPNEVTIEDGRIFVSTDPDER